MRIKRHSKFGQPDTFNAHIHKTHLTTSCPILCHFILIFITKYGDEERMLVCLVLSVIPMVKNGFLIAKMDERIFLFSPFLFDSLHSSEWNDLD